MGYSSCSTFVQKVHWSSLKLIPSHAALNILHIFQQITEEKDPNLCLKTEYVGDFISVTEFVRQKPNRSCDDDEDEDDHAFGELPVGPAWHHRCSFSSSTYLRIFSFPVPLSIKNKLTLQMWLEKLVDLELLLLARTNRTTVVSLTSDVSDDWLCFTFGSQTRTV